MTTTTTETKRKEKSNERNPQTNIRMKEHSNTHPSNGSTRNTLPKLKPSSTLGNYIHGNRSHPAPRTDKYRSNDNYSTTQDSTADFPWGEKGSITTIETIKTKQTLKAQIAERQIPMLNRPRISRYEPPIQKGTVDPDPHRTGDRRL